MQRLTENQYKRPKETLQDKLTDNEIKEKLKNYAQVDNIIEVPLSTHLRYFTKQNGGEMKFRLGGNLINKNNADKYVVLSNGKFTWSVDTNKSVFYKEISLDDVRKEYDEKIMKYKIVIKKLRKELEQYKN